MKDLGSFRRATLNFLSFICFEIFFILLFIYINLKKNHNPGRKKWRNFGISTCWVKLLKPVKTYTSYKHDLSAFESLVNKHFVYDNGVCCYLNRIYVFSFYRLFLSLCEGAIAVEPGTFERQFVLCSAT